MTVDRVRGGLLEDLFWRVKIARTPRTTITIDNIAGQYDIVVPEGASFIREYAESGTYEPILEKELYRRLSEADRPVYYDVGSRWGYFSKFSCIVGRPELTHAFDANPRWFDLLEQTHAEDLPEISMTNAYVGAEPDGETITIDGYRAGNDDPVIVKIDIEGAEYDALMGMERTLREVHPVVLVEIHPEYLRDRGYCDEAVFDLFGDVGYELDVTTEHRSEASEWESIDDVSLPAEGEYHLLAY